MQNNQVPLKNIIARNAMRTSLALQVFLHRSLALPRLTNSIQYCTLMCNYDDSVPTSARGCRLGPTAADRKFELNCTRCTRFHWILHPTNRQMQSFRWQVPWTVLDDFLLPLPKGSFPTMLTHGKIPLQVRWWLLLLSHNSLW